MSRKKKVEHCTKKLRGMQESVEIYLQGENLQSPEILTAPICSLGIERKRGILDKDASTQCWRQVINVNTPGNGIINSQSQ